MAGSQSVFIKFCQQCPKPSILAAASKTDTFRKL
jgi:hypothetical protein